jgi:hypothetical protein
MLQADEARKALSDLPGRLPKRLRKYMAVRMFGERALLRESRIWLHAVNGDPITGKDKRTVRKELFGRSGEEEEDPVDAESPESQAQAADADAKELEVDVTFEDPQRHGMPLTYLDGLSDIELSATSDMVKDNVVVLRWDVRGTHSRELLGVAPTQKAVTVVGITSIKFDEKPRAEGGREMWATDEWTFWDLPSLMQQIGAMP